MNKRLTCILLMLVVAFSFITGCGLSASASYTNSASEDATAFVGGMEYIGYSEGTMPGTMDIDKFLYYRDVVTDVMYVLYKEYRKGGMTAMLDPETGLPLTYTRYMELANTVAE